MCFKPHIETKKILFGSQIHDTWRCRTKRVSFVLCLPVQWELHWGILFNLSFFKIMIWHAGQFLTWRPHKNPRSIPRLNLHCKEGQRGAAQPFKKLSRLRNGDMMERPEEALPVNVSYLCWNIWGKSPHTFGCVHVCATVMCLQVLSFVR